MVRTGPHSSDFACRQRTCPPAGLPSCESDRLNDHSWHDPATGGWAGILRTAVVAPRAVLRVRLTLSSQSFNQGIASDTAGREANTSGADK
jgi:hypothetical protein